MAGMPMMPPGGGGGQNGGDIANQLMELVGPILQSPKGQMMVQALMSQMGGGGGGDPRAMMAQMGAPKGGGGFQGNPAANPGGNFDPTMPMHGGDMGYAEMDDALTQADGGVMRRPPEDNYATGEMGSRDEMRQTPMPSTEDELGMVQQQINGGGGGGGGMNPDGPTPEEVQLLKSSPTPRNIANFEKLFGPGSAQQVLAGGGGPAAPPSGGSTYEDDVKGAMDDAENDDGDHEYR